MNPQSCETNSPSALEIAQGTIHSLRLSLSHSAHHARALEQALAQVCREKDELQRDAQSYREAAAFFHANLADSRHEITHLKRQRRILAKHVRALLYLARPAEATVFPMRQRTPEQPIIADWSDPAPAYPDTLPPTLAERLVSWIRSHRQPRTSAA